MEWNQVLKRLRVINLGRLFAAPGVLGMYWMKERLCSYQVDGTILTWNTSQASGNFSSIFLFLLISQALWTLQPQLWQELYPGI